MIVYNLDCSMNSAITVNMYTNNFFQLNYSNVITSWASGTGAAGILGSLTYACLTGIFNMSPSSTMYLMLLVPTLEAVS